MKLPWVLFHYIGRHFLLSILLALLGLVAVGALIDTVELIRRASGKQDVPLGVIIGLAGLRLPYLAGKMTPYAVLIGSMLALTRLTRTHELIVVRAAGVSVWQFLTPALAVVLTLGVFITTAFNPFSATLLLRYERLEGKYLSATPSLLSISGSGLWLRQIENDAEIGEHIIYTSRVSQSTMEFSHVIVFTFDKARKFISRMDAAGAVLEEGTLRLREVTRSVPGQPPERLAEASLPTSLTLTYIQDSLASPETLSFWHLPAFIGMLEEAGFSALRHRLYWHSLLAHPFLMASTVLLAALFSLRLPRRGRIGLSVAAGITSGFLLHFFTDVIFAFGSAGTLPVMLAAWTPAIVMAMTGTALLLHFEDG